MAASRQAPGARKGEVMNLFGLMETSGSAMQAERMRAEVVAANMANAETTRTESGGPYRRQHVVFAANSGPGFAESLASASLTSASLTSGSFAGPSAIPASLAASPSQMGTRASQPAGGVHIAQVVEDP